MKLNSLPGTTKEQNQVHCSDVILSLLATYFSFDIVLKHEWNYIRPGIWVVIFFGLRKIFQLSSVNLTKEHNFRQILASLTGALFGLIVSTIVFLPTFLMSHYISNFDETIITIVFGLVALSFAKLFAEFEPRILQASVIKTASKNTNLIKILDTNALIDARIEKLVKARFVEGLLIIPEFVLDELKKIADDDDPIRKQRGRHALEVATEMIDTYDYVVKYQTEIVTDVDSTLITLARELSGKIITADANLIQLAEARDVMTININELSVAFQMVHLRGEKLKLKITEAGNIPGQGRGCTNDGTMIIVDNAARFIGQTIEVEVTRLLQSGYGFLVFAQIVST